MTFNLTYLERFDIRDEDAGLTEPSGLALAHDGDGFWTISDDTRRVFRLTRKGRVRRDRSFPVPEEDLEGIAAGPNGGFLFAVGEEDNAIVKLDIAKEAVTGRRRLADMSGYDAIARYFADGPENQGLEGVTWNAKTGSLFAIKEGHPGLLIEVASELDEIRGHVILDERNGFAVPEGQGRTVDFSGICHDASRAAFWIVSDRARRVFLYDDDANRVIDSAPLGYGKGGRYREVRKAEGVAVDPATGRLYVLSDKKARLYVYDIRS